MILDTLFFFLKNLKTLLLFGQRRAGYYATFFLPKFEKLQVLNLSSTGAGDRCLQILGIYCKDLRFGILIYMAGISNE